jgi:broad specificity phosphatase PhoE
MVTQLILARHPPVALAWQKRCYGRSDPGLSRDGTAMLSAVAAELVVLRPKYVLHSEQRRTRPLAERVARSLGIEAYAAPLWRERDFGSWEGQSWHQIYSASGSAMDRMLTDPQRFKPGGGETTAEMVARIRQALARLPSASCGLVVTHGGPIAAARLILSGSAEVSDLMQWVIKPGGFVILDRRDSISVQP